MAIIDLIDPIPQGFFGLSGDLRSGHNTYFYETDGQSFEADTIGRYIGEGLGGIVFRLMDEDSNPTDKVFESCSYLRSRRKLECLRSKTQTLGAIDWF